MQPMIPVSVQRQVLQSSAHEAPTSLGTPSLSVHCLLAASDLMITSEQETSPSAWQVQMVLSCSHDSPTPWVTSSLSTQRVSKGSVMMTSGRQSGAP